MPGALEQDQGIVSSYGGVCSEGGEQGEMGGSGGANGGGRGGVGAFTGWSFYSLLTFLFPLPSISLARDYHAQCQSNVKLLIDCSEGTLFITSMANSPVAAAA